MLLCSNHISNLDPPTVGILLKRKVHFMAKAELFNVPVLGPLIGKLGAFPVKRGGVSKESIKLALNILRDGKVMGIFPEGSRGAGGIGKRVLQALRYAVERLPFRSPLLVITSFSVKRKCYTVNLSIWTLTKRVPISKEIHLNWQQKQLCLVFAR